MISASTKYVPQAYIHFKQQVVSGLSMGFVFLDLIGALLSVVLMFLMGLEPGEISSLHQSN